MSELFGVKPQNVTIHLKNIYAEEELVKEGTCKEFLQVQIEGSRKVERARLHYNFDAIISVGNLDQSVFGEPAYPSIESKAVHLLYFVINDVGLAALTLLTRRETVANITLAVAILSGLPGHTILDDAPESGLTEGLEEFR
ncbi:hypothetical protein [Chromohalobacter sp. 11-W]|uniref:hypothetical protein n=1 Tax=Chromohalobacter sp. 11-W TaxID=2994061 RepID=UPI002468D01A|nr:hypothetical protein [Chromohalobacter sp. 11-W]